MLITSIGDLLNLFEFHCLEFQVFLLLAVTPELFDFMNNSHFFY